MSKSHFYLSPGIHPALASDSAAKDFRKEFYQDVIWEKENVLNKLIFFESIHKSHFIHTKRCGVAIDPKLYLNNLI